MKVNRIFLVIFSLIPIRYTHVNYPSHDLVGLFYFALFLLCITYLIKQIKRIKLWNLIVIVLLLVILLFILEIQRSLGILISLTLVAIIFIYLIRNNQLEKSTLIGFLFISIIIFYCIINNIVTKNEAVENDKPNIVSASSMLFSNNSIGTGGTYPEGANLRYNYFTKISTKNDALKYGISNYISQVYYQPLGYLKTLVNKSINLTSFRAFHFLKIPANSRLENMINSLNYANNLLRAVLFGLAIIGLYTILSSASSLTFISVFFVAFSGLFLLILLFFSEVGPSYMFIILPFVCYFGAIGFDKISQKKSLGFFELISITKILSKYTFYLVVIIFSLFGIIYISWHFLPFKTLNFSKDIILKNDNFKNNNFLISSDLSHIKDSIVFNLPNEGFRKYQIFIKSTDHINILSNSNTIVFSKNSNNNESDIYLLTGEVKNNKISIIIDNKEIQSTSKLEFEYLFVQR